MKKKSLTVPKAATLWAKKVLKGYRGKGFTVAELMVIKKKMDKFKCNKKGVIWIKLS